jgi:hypothetical protein
MRLPLPRFLGVFAIAVTAVFAAAGAANAATINVCNLCAVVPGSQYPDIQSAVNAANPAGGDVIDVGTGTFAAAVIDRPVTLNGVQAGNDARDRVPGAPLETVVTPGPVGFGALDVNANHVTIDGFTFTSGAPGVWLRPGFSDYTVLNNVFFDNTIALYVASNGADSNLVRHNKFEVNNTTGPASGNGIYGDQGASRYLIDENEFLGNNNGGVLIVTTPVNGYVNRDIRVTDNLFDRASDPPNNENGLGVGLLRTENAVISGNEMHDLVGSGVYLESSKDVDIADNEFDNADGFSAVRMNVANFDPSTNVANQDVSVVGNDIHDQGTDGGGFPGYGVRVSNGANRGPLEVHFNRIVGNTVGVRNEDTDAGDLINAENNWWGCNEGPSHNAANANGCDKTEGVNANPPGPVNDAIVDSDPWLVLNVASAKDTLALNGAKSKLSAGLRQNSDDDEFDTPPVPDKPVAFASTLGTVAPPSDVMHLGGAFSELTSGATAGDADVTAALDNEVAHTTVKLADPPPPPQDGADGATGAQGPAGPAGPQGPAGPTGPAGLPAQQVSSGEAETPDTRVVGCSLTAPVSTPLRSFVRVRASCEESVRYSAEATVAVPFTNGKGRSSARRFTLRSVRTGVIPAGQTVSIRMLLTDSVIEAARRGLSQGRRSSVRIKVTATDSAGNRKTMAATVRIRR